MIIKGIIFTIFIFLSLFSYLFFHQDTIQTGKIYGVNHVNGTHMQWFTVNNIIGFDIQGKCCSLIPDSWKSGEMLFVEWQVINVPPRIKDTGYSEIISSSAMSSDKIQVFKKKVKLLVTSKSCDLQFHFLPCEEIIIIPSCQNSSSPTYSIQEPQDRMPYECNTSFITNYFYKS